MAIFPKTSILIKNDTAGGEREDFNNVTANSKKFFMTIDELNIRIDKSMDGSENEKLTTSAELISEIEKWG